MICIKIKCKKCRIETNLKTYLPILNDSLNGIKSDNFYHDNILKPGL